MKSIYYSVPSSLTKEKEILEAKCDLLIEAFNQLCKEEEARIVLEKKEKANSRIFNYSIKELDGGWKCLYKEATDETKIGDDRDIQHSKPFKIMNGVLFHGDFNPSIGGKSLSKYSSFGEPTKLIPQGLFDKTEEQLLEIKW